MGLSRPERREQAKQRHRIIAETPEHRLQQQIRLHDSAVEIDDKRPVFASLRIGFNKTIAGGQLGPPPLVALKVCE
jgi:hypothetical protein